MASRARMGLEVQGIASLHDQGMWSTVIEARHSDRLLQRPVIHEWDFARPPAIVMCEEVRQVIRR